MLILCHSLEGNAGALTNFEVLDFLRAKEASKDPTRGIAKVAQSEYKVYDYLVDSAASVQTRESINEFLTSVKQHDLTKTEVLNILNIGPAADFELYPVIYYQTVFDKSTFTLFVASDQAGKVPLYWGITADGYVAFVDDAALLKGSCGKSLASFPLGCFYSIAVGGLRCYENPKNKIVAIPAKEEEIRGAFFKNRESVISPNSNIRLMSIETALGTKGKCEVILELKKLELNIHYVTRIANCN
ncbi:hypothetical protein HKD37_12G034636 [Glycine soja]|nr:hypothetical protein glysoja_034429 [Glycine soja]